MGRVSQALELARKGDLGEFAKDIPQMQRLVEDLCKLGYASKIIDETKQCLEQQIGEKFGNLVQMSLTPN